MRACRKRRGQFADCGQLLPGGGAGRQYCRFRRNGLDSGGQFLAGAPASLFGLTPDTGAAFAGINPLVGRNTMFFPAGRSLYSGLQVSVRTHVTNPVRGVVGGTLQFSYTHASFRSNIAGGIGDQDLLPLAADFNHPTAYLAPHRRTASTSFPWARSWTCPAASAWV